MVSVQAAVPNRHVHSATELCPTCEQPIPNDRADEVRKRLEAQRREAYVAAETRAAQLFAVEKTRIETGAQQKIDAIAAEAANKEAAARDEGKRSAEQAAAAKVAALEAVAHEREVATKRQVEALQHEREHIKTSLEQLKTDKANVEAAAEAKLAALTDEVTQREDAARATGVKQAEDAAAAKIADAARAAETREAALVRRIEAAEAAKAAAEVAVEHRLNASEQQREAALAELNELKTNHDQEVHKVREIMEREKNDALNSQNSRHFEAMQKLTEKLAELQRQVERKTAEELGEGAEINLYDELCTEFPDDRIERVGKGSAGADIIQQVMHNGSCCGRIIFDSKNATWWRWDYVAKLRKDQIAANADHAILSILKFPPEARQILVHEDVIVANPARVVTVVHMLRKHLIEVNALRLSKTERAKKMAALYDYMTSKRCGQFLDTIDNHASKLLELQDAERKQHERNWKQQGTLYCSIQKSRADFAAEIDKIIGTASSTG